MLFVLFLAKLTFMLVGVYGANVFQQAVVHIHFILVMVKLLFQGFQFLCSKSGNLGLLPKSVEFLVLEKTLVSVSLLGVLEFLKVNLDVEKLLLLGKMI